MEAPRFLVTLVVATMVSIFLFYLYWTYDGAGGKPFAHLHTAGAPAPTTVAAAISGADVYMVRGIPVPIPKSDAQFMQKLRSAKLKYVPKTDIVTFSANQADWLNPTQDALNYDASRVVTEPFATDNNVRILLDGSNHGAVTLPQNILVNGSASPMVFTPPSYQNGRQQFASLSVGPKFVPEMWMRLFTVHPDGLDGSNMRDAEKYLRAPRRGMYVPLLLVGLYVAPNLCTGDWGPPTAASNSNRDGQYIDCAQAPTMPAVKVYAMADTGSGSFITTAPSPSQQSQLASFSGSNKACVQYAMGPACGSHANVTLLVKGAPQADNRKRLIMLQNVSGLFDTRWSIAENSNYATDVSILGLAPVPDMQGQRAQPFITALAESTRMRRCVALWLKDMNNPRMLLGQRPAELASVANVAPALQMLTHISPFNYYPCVLALTIDLRLNGQTQGCLLRNIPCIFDSGTTRPLKMTAMGERAAVQQLNSDPFPARNYYFDEVVIQCLAQGQSASVPPQGLIRLQPVMPPGQQAAVADFLAYGAGMNTLVFGINAMTGLNWYMDFSGQALYVQ